ncbi:MAG: type IV toxin-antitoxin system AbiEi family antitoxin domain-containing protein [Rhodospirillaceae bacterium]
MCWLGIAPQMPRASPVRAKGTVTSKELQQIGVHRCYLTYMCAKGLLVRVGHGLYRATTEAAGVASVVAAGMKLETKKTRLVRIVERRAGCC